jgi:catechol 2,3-dioxygenase-like lactoylglutathione lyase family enzyme
MLRVKGLLHYGLQVPSLDTGASFYNAFGLETAERGNAVVIRCDGREQDQTVLMEGATKQLHHVAFAVEPDSLIEWQGHLEGLGVKLLDAPADVPGGLGSAITRPTWSTSVTRGSLPGANSGPRTRRMPTSATGCVGSTRPAG